MHMRTHMLSAAFGLGLLILVAGQSLSQGPPPWAGKGKGPGAGRQGGGGDAQFIADRDVFHYLLENHEGIRREVKNTDGGVETLTESDKPELVAKIQEHVAAMAKRVEEVRPIHMRDPLFAELFGNAKKIHLKYEKTDKGIRVVETSEDPAVVKLIQAHGGVVSLFVKNGFEEARKNHEVPGKAAADNAAAGCAANCPNNACPKACPNCPAGKGCPRAGACGNCPKKSACETCPNKATCELQAPSDAPPLPKAPESPKS